MKSRLAIFLLCGLTLVCTAAIVIFGCSSQIGAVRSTAGGATQNRVEAPPGSLPSLDEEVWVIVKADPAAGALPDADVPGTGALVGRLPGAAEDDTVPMPLEHTDVDAKISAYIASVNVTQRFHNPYDAKIEAMYVFPLPQNAAVSGFVMTIGERRIRGILREREEAERVYQEARAQGHVASLLTQERPNVFTQRVANIEPGRRVDVDVTYFHTLAYDEGWHEFVFPMVVGPRFNPSGSTGGVGAVPRGDRGASGQTTEVQYLAPHERSGNDIALAVTIDAGTTVEEIDCRSHRIDVDRRDAERVRVAIRSDDVIPNKDFVLRYRIAGAQVKTALLTHQSAGNGYFTLVVYPPQRLAGEPRHPMEMVFVLDCSGSMRGEPMAQSRAAIQHALNQLQPEDTFQIIRFSNDASQLGSAPLPATQENVRNGLRYVRSLEATGGTMMIRGIEAALDFPHDPERLRYVVFLTDGYIGNERQILGTIHDRLGASRIFSFGVGSSPNRYLMNRMAKIGGGAVAYLGLEDDGADVMDAFFRRASHPVMTDVAIAGDGIVTSEVMPARGDLFVGRPLVFSGRYRGTAPSELVVAGRTGGQVVTTALRFDADTTGTHAALSHIWARAAIADVMDRATWDDSIDLEARGRALALDHGLMSAWTAFVAVDSSRRTEGDHGTTVPVAVPVPDGVSYETTVASDDGTVEADG